MIRTVGSLVLLGALSLGLTAALLRQTRLDREARQRSDAAMAIYEQYGSAPKGVILENPLRGLPAITKVDFDGRTNRFALNDGAFFYQCPVSKADFSVICRSVAQNDRIGVSIKKDKSFFTYGALPQGSNVGRDLAEADRILGGTAFATADFIRGVRLPQNYQPKSATNRKIWPVATFKFFNYSVAPAGQNVYRRGGFNFDARIIPVDQFRKAPDGGFIPHREHLARGITGEPEDVENVQFIVRNQNEFFAMPQIARAIDIGEATAFVRLLKSSGVNLNDVANRIR